MGMQGKAGLKAGVAGVAIALAVGGFGLAGCSSAGSVAAVGTTTATEDQLDDTIATYTYDGTTTNVTSKMIIEDNTTLEAAKNEDDTYNYPTADDVLSYVRNHIVLAEAEKEGITVTDEEVDAFSESSLGTSDYATIATNYGLDEDTVKQMITDSATMSKLRDQVCDVELPDYPTAPTEPAEGEEDTPTAEYAQYIIALAGDEWDSETGTWAADDTDGDYYTALASYDITNDSATYEAASAAYEVAYNKYSTASSNLSTEWTNYVNGLFSQCSVTIGTVAS